jgi:hypothetical protein
MIKMAGKVPNKVYQRFNSRKTQFNMISEPELEMVNQPRSASQSYIKR